MNHGLIRRAAMLAAPLLTAFALLMSGPAQAAGADYPLDSFPVSKLNDLPALQNGAKLYVNYCMGCHSLNSMRYNRMSDLGLSDDQIKDNLMFTGDKVGDPMSIAMQGQDAKEWFGVLPPDLSVKARARSSSAGSGSDWIYTFLRTYYRDSERSTGWNNALFQNVGMPNVLWTLQGTQAATRTEIKATGEGVGAEAFTEIVTNFALDGAVTRTEGTPANDHPHVGKLYSFEPAVGGMLNPFEFDNAVADITAFLTYVSDPTAKLRTAIGVWVLVFLGVLFGLALWLNATFWKDIK